MFDKALAINPGYVDLIYDKGMALNGLGKYEESTLLIEKAMQLNPVRVDRLHEMNIEIRNFVSR